MDTLDFSVIFALVSPIYAALWMINGKVGKYDQVCRDVRILETEVKALWAKSAGE